MAKYRWKLRDRSRGKNHGTGKRRSAQAKNKHARVKVKLAETFKARGLHISSVKLYWSQQQNYHP